MKIKYLGTGAAERVPGIFCKCEVCENARKTGGREIRTQTQFIINNELMIDFPGDSFHHLLEYDLDYTKFKNLLLTHWHSDHFYGEDLAYRMSNYANNLEFPMNAYGNKTVYEFYERAFKLEDQHEEERLKYNMIYPYQHFKIDQYTVYPLPAMHGWFKEDCFIFAIDDGNDVFLSTHDSGYFTPEMFDYLQKNGLEFSVVSLDCTSQTKQSAKNHMNWEDNLKFINELKRRNLVNKETKYVANHFSHNGGLTYKQMSEITEKENVITSYDGLEVFTD